MTAAPWYPPEAVDALLAAAQQRQAFLDDRARGREPIIDQLMAALRQERQRAEEAEQNAAGFARQLNILHSSDLRQTCAALEEQVRVAETELAEIEVAVRKLCPPEDSEDWPADETAPRYVCLGEDGDPIIEADTRAEALDQARSCWVRTAERMEVSEEQLRVARAALARCEAFVALVENADPSLHDTLWAAMTPKEGA